MGIFSEDDREFFPLCGDVTPDSCRKNELREIHRELKRNGIRIISEKEFAERLA